MNIRMLTVAVLLFLIIPRVGAGQTPNPARLTFDRLSVEVGAGPLLASGGNTLSAAVGFSPIPRLDLLVNIERDAPPFQRQTIDGGYSLTRGGTLTTISGEVRLSALLPHRVSPYVFAGIGGGVSRPTVNDEFPEAVRNDLRIAYAGAGVRVPLRDGLSIFGDARAMLTSEGDGILGVWPVRAGIAWRF